jgi:hypothetical protein
VTETVRCPWCGASCPSELGCAPEAAEPLAAARAIVAALSARPALDETDGLLVTVGLAVSGDGQSRPLTGEAPGAACTVRSSRFVAKYNET